MLGARLGSSKYHSLGHQIQLSLGEFEKAKKHLLKELAWHEEKQNHAQIPEVYLHLATLCLLMGDFDAADEHNYVALEYFRSTHDINRVAHGLWTPRLLVMTTKDFKI